MLKTCAHCQKEFWSSKTETKFCSRKCYDLNRKQIVEEKICPKCGEIFTPPKDNPKKIFCSRSCANSRGPMSKKNKELRRQWIKENNVGFSQGHEPPNKGQKSGVYINCQHCNREFYIFPNEIGKRKYCSMECAKFYSGGSTRQNILYIDSVGQLVNLDSTWELIVANELDKNNIFWIRPKRFILSNKKSYTPDFYLPKFNIFLDPKATWRKKRIKEDLKKISLFEKEYHTRCFVIDDEQNLTWNHIHSLIIDLY